MVLRKVNESSKAVMDSTFYLAPHACSEKKKNGKVEFKSVTTDNSMTYLTRVNRQQKLLF